MPSLRPVRRLHAGGFSLIELAIGLVIVATLLSALLVPLATQMDQRRVTETQKQLEAARDALIGYAIANGRLPCPAQNNGDGTETFVPGPGGTRITGECLNMNGFLPGVTLGLSPLDEKGYFRDAYGTASNRIRYAVSTENVDRWSSTSSPTGPSSASCNDRVTKAATEPRVFTKTRGMANVGMAMIAQAAECDSKFLIVCTKASSATNACAPADNQTLSNGGAAAVIWSVGRNASDTGRVAPADELANLDLDNDRIFVARERRDRREDTDNEFDDIVLWISPSVLFARMTAAGALP